MLTRGASITELFLELVAIPSPSGSERALGEQIRDWLAACGVPAEFDGTGHLNGSDAGNLIATVAGAPGAAVHLFVAHMDTVESGSEPVAPSVGGDGVIRSSGRTILGADNKSAVAAVMRLCAAAARMPVTDRPTVVAAFTCREETGRMGASLLELGDRRIDCAFCVDGSRPIGTVITRALGQTVFTITVQGRAAHAAANPDAGISAIRVASEIVAALPLGRQPGGGSVSIAAIVGGAVIARLGPRALAAQGIGDGADGDAAVRAALESTATNSVPDLVHLRGEVRGYSLEAIEQTVAVVTEIVGRVCEAHGSEYRWARDHERMIPPLPGATGSRALELVSAAAARVPGVTLVEEQAAATLEANYLARRSDVVAVASGGRDPHQTTESITTTELEQLDALLVAIIGLGVGP